jgi:hypothetical protein
MNIRNKSAPNASILETLQKYWFLLLVIILGIPYLIRYYKNQAVTDIVNDVVQNEKEIVAQNQNPTTQLQGLNKITTRIDLHEIARNIAYNFGTSVRTKETTIMNLSWWNPKGWTENDEKAYNQLKKINYASSRDLVAKCYYFLTRNNLYDDVKNLLDEEYRSKLPLFK